VTGQLFGGARPVEETVGHGHRTTPAAVVQLLYSLPEFKSRRGATLDLGCGDGAIARELARLDAASGLCLDWELVDIRRDALDSMAGWYPRRDADGAPMPHSAEPHDTLPAVRLARVHRHQRDAVSLSPLDCPTMRAVDQVVSNPPWAIQRCPRCERTWEAQRCQHCTRCSTKAHRVIGEDLAQVMVAEAMLTARDADVWVIHTLDWRFHPARMRFFLPSGDGACTRPRTHRVAGITDVATRIAWGDPSARGPVKPHNKMMSLYHFEPVWRSPVGEPPLWRGVAELHLDADEH